MQLPAERWAWQDDVPKKENTMRKAILLLTTAGIAALIAEATLGKPYTDPREPWIAVAAGLYAIIGGFAGIQALANAARERKAARTQQPK
jgi:hypothetical protein